VLRMNKAVVVAALTGLRKGIVALVCFYVGILAIEGWSSRFGGNVRPPRVRVHDVLNNVQGEGWLWLAFSLSACLGTAYFWGLVKALGEGSTDENPGGFRIALRVLLTMLVVPFGVPFTICFLFSGKTVAGTTPAFVGFLCGLAAIGFPACIAVVGAMRSGGYNWPSPKGG